MDSDDPWPTRIALLTIDRLVMTDCSNASVKLVDVDQHTILDQLKVDGKPWGACRLSESKAAVTLPDEHRIIILDCKNKLFIENTIFVQHECRDIAYNNEQLIVRYRDYRKIEIMRLNGEVVKQTLLGTRNILYANSLSVISEENATSIFVSDYSNSRIVRLDDELQEQQVYPLPGGATQSSLYAMGEGQLLLWSDNGSFWQLDSTMGLWTALVGEGGLSGAWSMVFCHNRRVLYCTHFDDAVVKRYSFS